MELIDLTQKYLQIITQKEVNNLGLEECNGLIENLIRILNYHNNLYYELDNPQISDYEYDMLYSFFKKIENKYPQLIKSYSPTQQLNISLNNKFTKVPHQIPMLSLENSYQAEDLSNWAEFLQKQFNKNSINIWHYVIEPKYDGISIELIYKKGKLIQGITRGNGLIGEDITENILHVGGIPHILSDNGAIFSEIIIRGEILLPKSQLSKINQIRLAEGKSLLANTRNAAAGSLRQLDAQISAARGLIFYAYELTNYYEIQSQSDSYTIDILEKQFTNWGFQFLKFSQNIKDNIQDVINFCLDSNISSQIENRDIDIDGLVIKIDELKYRNLIGSTGHHPRWAQAYKFPTKQISTQLLGVEYQVGRTGIITPVAQLESINLRGVNITKATLHNFNFIVDKDIQIGDFVWVQRSGEVIPYILGPIKERRQNTTIITPPYTCPICKSLIHKDEVYYYCTNIACPAIILEQIKHFVSRNAMNIPGLGEKFIEILMSSGLIKDISDLYFLSQDQNRLKLKALPLFGAKRIADILIQIEKSKQNLLENIIFALGIKFVGKKGAQMLAKGIFWDLLIDQSNPNYEKTNSKEFENISLAQIITLSGKTIHQIEKIIHNFDIKNLINYLQCTEKLNKIYGLGDKTVQVIQIYLANTQNINLLEKLANLGIKFNIREDWHDNFKEKNKGLHLNICLSGTLPYTREKIKKILAKYGAKFHDNINQSIDLLIIGDNPSNKLQFAQTNNINILNFLQLLDKYPFLKAEFTITIKKRSQMKGIFSDSNIS